MKILNNSDYLTPDRVDADDAGLVFADVLIIEPGRPRIDDAVGIDAECK